MQKNKINSGISALNLLKENITNVTKGANLSENNKHNNKEDESENNSKKTAISIEIPDLLLNSFKDGVSLNKIPKVSRASYFVTAIWEKMKKDNLI